MKLPVSQEAAAGLLYMNGHFKTTFGSRNVADLFWVVDAPRLLLAAALLGGRAPAVLRAPPQRALHVLGPHALHLTFKAQVAGPKQTPILIQAYKIDHSFSRF